MNKFYDAPRFVKTTGDLKANQIIAGDHVGSTIDAGYCLGSCKHAAQVANCGQPIHFEWFAGKVCPTPMVVQKSAV